MSHIAGNIVLAVLGVWLWLFFAAIGTILIVRNALNKPVYQSEFTECLAITAKRHKILSPKSPRFIVIVMCLPFIVMITGRIAQLLALIH